MSFSEVINMINKHGQTLTMIHVFNGWQNSEKDLEAQRKALRKAEIAMESAKAAVRHFITQAAQNGLTKKTDRGHVLNVEVNERKLLTFFIGYDSDGPLEVSETEIQVLPT